MVSISNIKSSARDASSYYEKDDYYTKSVGEWGGNGAELLGLQGTVDKKEFQHLLSGQDKDGNQLVVNGPGEEHRPGLDLTFSPPKSVSILSEIVGDPRMREAHEKAVSAALTYVEDNFTKARTTLDGTTGKVSTSNFVVAKFQHHMSRELDPQLHTHSVILNITKRPDEKWRAISNEEIYKNKILIGQVYRNELALLLKEQGFHVDVGKKGFFEVGGIPKDLLDGYSRRSEQINQKETELKELFPNLNGQRLREMATLGSRAAKKDVDMEVIKEDWHNRLKSYGFTKKQLQETVMKAGIDRVSLDKPRSALEYIRLAVKARTEHESTFTKEDILKEAAKVTVGQYKIGELNDAFMQLAMQGNVKSLDEKTFTTEAIEKAENEIVAMIKKGHNIQAALEPQPNFNRYILAHEKENVVSLTKGQRDAIEHIVTSKDSVIGIQGDAGVGKTTSLSVAKKILEDSGFQVWGMAFTGKAASEMRAASGIISQTVDSFLKSDKSGHKKQVLIVDEASLLGSKKLHQLLKAGAKLNAKVVLIGDVKQLQPISAGSIFKKLQEDEILKTVEMRDVVRQTDPNYKDIVVDIANKRMESAFQKIESQSRMEEIADKGERYKAITNEFMGSKSDKTIIVTAINEDRKEFNRMIKKELKTQKKLSTNEFILRVMEPKNIETINRNFAHSYSIGDQIITSKAGIIGRAGSRGVVTGIDPNSNTIKVRTPNKGDHTISMIEYGQEIVAYTERHDEFSQGQKIVFLKNDKDLIVKNGETGIIKMIEGTRVEIKKESGAIVKINTRTQYNFLDSGYAVTSYKSQGQTSQKVIYHADTTNPISFNHAYVAVTRGKEDFKIFTDDKEKFKRMASVELEKTSTLNYQKETDINSGRQVENRGDRSYEKASGRGSEMSLSIS